MKYVNPVICKFSSDIFHVCLSEGSYPDLLKIAEVIPILTKSERNKTTNYHLISFSQFNKIFEKIIIINKTLLQTPTDCFTPWGDHQGVCFVR